MYLARPDPVTEWKMDAQRPVERVRRMHSVGSLGARM